MCPRGRPRGQGRPREFHLCQKVRNVITMMLNSCFLMQNHQNFSAAGDSSPIPVFSHYIFTDYASYVTRLSCISLFSTGPKSANFCAKKILLLFLISSLSKILVACRVAFTVIDRFFKRLWATNETS